MWKWDMHIDTHRYTLEHKSQLRRRKSVCNVLITISMLLLINDVVIEFSTS